jgi:hypothetical protein
MFQYVGVSDPYETRKAFSWEFYDHHENNGFGLAGPLLGFPFHGLNLIISNKQFFLNPNFIFIF